MKEPVGETNEEKKGAKGTSTGTGKNKRNFHRTLFCPAIADYCSTVDVFT